jgi:uncharacterized membrane protein
MSGLIGIDTYIALGLIGIIIVVFLVYRMGLLPKKSLPFIVGGLLALFGIHLLRQSRKNALKKELEKLEKKLDKKEKELEGKKEELDVSEQELQEVQAEADKQRAAIKKELLLNETKEEKEKQRIEELSTVETFSEFDQVFGG